MSTGTFLRQKLKRGDTWILEVVFDDGQDVSAWTWSCQWRTSPSASTAFTTATVDASLASTGKVTLTVPASVTGTVTPPVSYYFDVQRTASGVVETVASGKVDVDWDVTR